jgi:dihydrodipicolinate synthase/N-acetylneuraminate lyase
MPKELTREPRAGGVVVAAITPWRADDASIDIPATFELIDFLSAKKPSGIALFGSTGEFPHFSIEERARLAVFAVKRSRVPVFVNASHSTLAGSLRLAEEATRAGAAGLLLMPPYYFRYTDGLLKEFFLQASAHAARLAPLYLYNIPFFTNPLPVQTAVELLETGRFAGIKDSSGDWEYFERLLALRESTPFHLLIGNDRILARARESGADGAVSGVSCALPELILALDAAVRDGDERKKNKLEARLAEFLDWTKRFPTPVAVKIAVEARGLRPGALAAPLGAEGGQLLEQYRGWLSGWIPQVLADAHDTSSR